MLVVAIGATILVFFAPVFASVQRGSMLVVEDTLLVAREDERRSRTPTPSTELVLAESTNPQ